VDGSGIATVTVTVPPVTNLMSPASVKSAEHNMLKQSSANRSMPG
jgi:hypothetical protein